MLMNVFVKPNEQPEARFKGCHGEKRCMLMNDTVKLCEHQGLFPLICRKWAKDLAD